MNKRYLLFLNFKENLMEAIKCAIEDIPNRIFDPKAISSDTIICGGFGFNIGIINSMGNKHRAFGGVNGETNITAESEEEI